MSSIRAHAPAVGDPAPGDPATDDPALGDPAPGDRAGRAGGDLPQPGTGGGDLLLTDLFLDLASALAFLAETSGSGDWLDAYLLCAAADQIVEDALLGRRSPGGRAWWRRVERELDRSAHTRPLALGVRAGVEAADRLSEWTPLGRQLIRAHQSIASLRDLLAGACLEDPLDAADRIELADRIRGVAHLGGTLPAAISLELLRLPSSFRSFDQRPADIEALAGRFAQRWPGRGVALTVVGVRTSGSYLAPLAGAALRRLGFQSVDVLTLRPGTTPGPHARRLLRSAASGSGLVLLLDDPPVSGHSIRAVAQRLESEGIPAGRIVLLLALHPGRDQPPEALRRYPSVVLPWADWDVQRSLQPDAVASNLAGMLGPGEVITGIRRLLAPSSNGRGHVLARYFVEVQAREPALSGGMEVAVEGSGLGFFGRHSLAVSTAMAGAVPTVYGFKDGLIYRQWLPETARRLPRADPEACADIGAYVARRHMELPADRDRSETLFGNQPAWEVAAAILARALGRPGIILRPFLVDSLARRLLKAPQPSVVDGRMEAHRWFGSEDTRILKTAHASGAFSNRDLASYDPVFDLAGAAVAAEDPCCDPAAVAALRRSFEESAGTVVDEERWLLYQLVHLWDAERLERRPVHHLRRAAARSFQRYIASVYLDDLPPATGGPLCAIDVDGVLESSTFGFSATTSAGALALRALRAHGYRAVLVTGRSLDEVIDRCGSYQLAGGVAEYGAAIYNHAGGQVVPLTPEGSADAVARLKSILSARDGIEIDPGFEHIARVRQHAKGCPDPALLEGLPPLRGWSWQFVAGDDQMDILPPEIDKGRGLRSLAALLGGEHPGEDRAATVALAVGDTEADIPMFRVARMAVATANASPGLRRSAVERTRAAYQSGLAEAVGRLIGHEPGSCRACRPPSTTDRRRLLLQLLSAQEAGGRGIALRVAVLAWGLATQAASR